MDSIKATLDALNTDGGHILIALGLIVVGLIVIGHWKMSEGHELFLIAVGLLGKAMNSTGKANGHTTTTSETVVATIEEKK